MEDQATIHVDQSSGIKLSDLRFRQFNKIIEIDRFTSK
jgi:hypothetical protein